MESKRWVCGRTLLSVSLVVIDTSAPADDSSLERGDRVRVEAPRFSVNPLVGTIHSLDMDSLLLAPTSETRVTAIALRDIRSLEVGRGRSRRTGWGALTGAVIFGAGGGYLGSQSDDETPGLSEVYPAGLAIAFAIPGAGLGALAGAFIRGEERWEPIEVDRIHLGSE